MKKRLISLLAAMTMLLSVVPMTASAEKTDDNFTGDNTIIENEHEGIPDLRQRPADNEHHDVPDLLMLTEELHADEPGVDYSENCGIELMSEDEITVSGTVSLPVAAPQDGRIGVYLYELKKDGNKIIKSSNVSAAYSNINIAKGAKSVSYSLTVPKGSYAVAARYLDGDGKVLNETTYYREEGNSYCIEGADAVTADTRADIMLNSAERSISGTVTFSSPISKDCYAYITCYDSDKGGYYYQSIPVQQGQTALDYSIGVKKGIYQLEISVDGGNYEYYSTTGTTGDYDDICYLNTADKSLSGIDFTYNNSAEIQASATITVNLGKASDKDKRYSLQIWSGNSYNSSSIDVPAGQTSFSKTVAPKYSGNIIIAVEDLTDIGIRHNTSVRYYYSKEYGITPDKNLATKLTIAEADGLTINFPESDTLTGTVQRNGCRSGSDLDLYVYAKIGTETFFDAVTIDASADNAPYSIDIPNRLKGSHIEVYASIRSNNSNMPVNAFGESVFVTGTDAEIAVNAPADAFKKVSGTITLGVPAPADGLVFKFYSRNTVENSNYSFITASYFVPEGETELSYTIDVLDTAENRSANGDVQARLTVSSNDSRLYTSSKTITFDSDTKNINLPYKSQTISGTVKTPGGQKLPTAVSYEVYANYSMPDGETYYIDMYNSIMKGETESKYTLNIPPEATLTMIEMYMQSIGASPVYNAYLYYNGSGVSEDYAKINIPMTNGLKNIDFELIKGKLITGEVSVPDDFEGEMYFWGYTDDSSGSGKTITSGGTYPYAVTARYDTQETDVYLGFSDSDVSNYYNGDTYYNSEGSTYNINDAETVTLNGERTDGINFNLIKGKNISCTLSFEDGAYISGNQLNGWIYASGGSFRNGAYIRSYDTESMDYCISIPEGFNETFNIYVDVYSNSNTSTNIAEGNYYYTGSGKLNRNASQAKRFNAADIGSNRLDLVIPVGYCISGKIILPQGAVGTVESAYIDIRPALEGDSLRRRVKIADDGSYKVFIAPNSDSASESEEPKNPDSAPEMEEPKNPDSASESEEPKNPDSAPEMEEPQKPDSAPEMEEPQKPDSAPEMEEPQVQDLYKIEINTTMSAVTNVLSGSYYYVSADKSSRNQDDARVVCVNGDTDNINFILECGKMISGKITVPEGAATNQYSSAYVSIEGTGFYKGSSVKLSGNETDFGIAIPSDAEGSIKICYNCNNLDDTVYTNTLYIGENAPVSDSENAKEFTIGDDGVSGVNIQIVKKLAEINYTAYRPSYADRDYYLSPSVYAVLDNGKVLSGYVYIGGGKATGSESIIIPDITEYNNANTFKMYYDIYRYDTGSDRLSYKYSEMYINGNGTAAADEASATSFNLKDNKRIAFTVWDNSALVRKAVKDGDVSVNVSEAYLDADGSNVCVKLNTENNSDLTYNATLLVGEYTPDGTLVRFYTYVYAIEHENENEINIPIEVNSGNTYKLFSWDNIGFMSPLASSMAVTTK